MQSQALCSHQGSNTKRRIQKQAILKPVKSARLISDSQRRGRRRPRAPRSRKAASNNDFERLTASMHSLETERGDRLEQRQKALTHACQPLNKRSSHTGPLEDPVSAATRCHLKSGKSRTSQKGGSHKKAKIADLPHHPLAHKIMPRDGEHLVSLHNGETEKATRQCENPDIDRLLQLNQLESREVLSGGITGCATPTFSNSTRQLMEKDWRLYELETQEIKVSLTIFR